MVLTWLYPAVLLSDGDIIGGSDIVLDSPCIPDHHQTLQILRHVLSIVPAVLTSDLTPNQVWKYLLGTDDAACCLWSSYAGLRFCLYGTNFIKDSQSCSWVEPNISSFQVCDSRCKWSRQINSCVNNCYAWTILCRNGLNCRDRTVTCLALPPCCRYSCYWILLFRVL